MKIFLMLSSLVISLNTFAFQVTPPMGAFQFKGAFEVLTTKKYENVNTLTQAGKDRLKELQTQHWACNYVGFDFNQCSRFIKNETLPDFLVSQLQGEYQDFGLNFLAVDSINQTNSSDFLQEYEVHQNVEIKKQVVANYTMQVLNGGIVKYKMQADASADPIYFNQLDEKSIAATKTLRINERNTSTVFLVQVIFSKD